MDPSNCQSCPCGSQRSYNDCCGRFIENQLIPNHPEELMRSRYSAYTQAKIDYIMATMKSPASDNFKKEEAKHWAESVQWQGLEVIDSRVDVNRPNHGQVEFKAHYQWQNKDSVIHEISQFKKIENRWYYVDGKLIESKPTKAGRNDPCPCNSGKKFKKCCG